MVDKETVERRLLKLEQYVRQLRELAKVSFDEYLNDRVLQDSAERILQLAT